MDNKIKLQIIAISSYLLLVPIVIYLKNFQTFISPLITNITIFLLVFILASLLIYGSFLVKKTIHVYFILPQTLIVRLYSKSSPISEVFRHISRRHLFLPHCYIKHC